MVTHIFTRLVKKVKLHDKKRHQSNLQGTAVLRADQVKAELSERDWFWISASRLLLCWSLCVDLCVLIFKKLDFDFDNSIWQEFDKAAQFLPWIGLNWSRNLSLTIVCQTQPTDRPASSVRRGHKKYKYKHKYYKYKHNKLVKKPISADLTIVWVFDLKT